MLNIRAAIGVVFKYQNVFSGFLGLFPQFEVGDRATDRAFCITRDIRPYDTHTYCIGERKPFPIHALEASEWESRGTVARKEIAIFVRQSCQGYDIAFIPYISATTRSFRKAPQTSARIGKPCRPLEGTSKPPRDGQHHAVRNEFGGAIYEEVVEPSRKADSGYVVFRRQEERTNSVIYPSPKAVMNA